MNNLNLQNLIVMLHRTIFNGDFNANKLAQKVNTCQLLHKKSLLEIVLCNIT